MRRTSFSIFHEILDSRGTTMAKGYDIIVLFNYKKGEKEPIPAALRTLVESIEGKAFPVI